MTGLDPVSSDIYISCYYFYLDEQHNSELNTYLKDVVSVVHVVSNTFYIIFKFYLLLFLPLLNLDDFTMYVPWSSLPTDIIHPPPTFMLNRKSYIYYSVCCLKFLNLFPRQTFGASLRFLY